MNNYMIFLYNIKIKNNILLNIYNQKLIIKNGR